MLDTRNRILKAALETFSKYGFTGATTREIAKRAEVTEVTLFRYFPTKEKIFEEVVFGFLPGPDFEKIILDAKNLPYKESLLHIAFAFLNELKQNTGLLQVLYMESQQHFELMNDVYTALVNNITTLLAEYLIELQRKKTIRDFNPFVGAKMFLGSVYNFYEDEFLLRMAKSDEDFDETVTACVEIFVRGTQL